MDQQKKVKFGDRISFDEVFHDVVYIKEKDLERIKLYDVDEADFTVDLGEQVSDPLNGPRTIFRRALRKVLFRRESGDGIVIGQTRKVEGFYEPGCIPHGYFATGEDYDQAWLSPTKVYPFWIVATGMNKKVMVQK